MIPGLSFGMIAGLPIGALQPPVPDNILTLDNGDLLTEDDGDLLENS